MFSVSLHPKPKIDAYTDEQILEQMKTDNMELFEHIYNKRNKKIYSYVMTILNYNAEDANEIV